MSALTTSKRFIALMACLTGLTALGIDAVLPIFPEMIDYYQLPQDAQNSIQQVVFMYMLGFAVFQLLFGVLADTFGRKPLMLMGIGVFTLAAVCVIFIEQFDNMLIARFIQGAGLAAPRVLTTTIVRDVSDGREMSRIMSFITMIFLSVPAVAPMAGQVMVLFAPWQSVFILLTLLGVLLIVWVHYGMPETLREENRRPLALSKLVSAISEFLHQRITLIYLLMISTQFGSLMMYIGQSEQILQKDIYQLGHYFPFAFATVVVGMIAASITNANLVMRLGLQRLLLIGLIITTVVDSIFFICTLLGGGAIPLWLFLALFIAHFFSFGLIMPNLNTLALGPYHHIAGTASALIGMITTIVGLGFAQLFSHFYQHSLYAISSGFVFCTVLLLLAYAYLNTQHGNK